MIPKCSFTKLANIEELIPNPKNPNTHPQAQIELLAKVLKAQGFRQPIVVSKRSGFIVKGHGRLEASKLAGFSQVPIDEQEYENEAQEYADMIADNRLAEISELDNQKLKDLIQELDTGEIDLELTGFANHELEQFMSQYFQDDATSDNEQDAYTKKIKAPTYEIKGEKPPIEELYDLQKYQELIAQIEATTIDQNTKDFLKVCASRHIVFNYENIAEFYAHQNKETQEQMENSALVIIDFEKAIEKGFTNFSEEVRKQFKDDDNKQ
jgi:hypothetical protein